MKIKNMLILLLAAVIWGSAFVAQSVGMDHVGPFTFLWARSIVGGIVLLPVAFFSLKYSTFATLSVEQKRQVMHTTVLGGLCCGSALFFASGLQQVGLLYTTVGKSGFLTACYILMVPILGLCFGRVCSKKVWFGVLMALIGLYFLCITSDFTLGEGDMLSLLCAVVFAVDIMIIDHFSPKVDCVTMSCFQFFVVAGLSAVAMLLFEWQGAPLGRFGFAAPTWTGLWAARSSILYAGVLSSGVAYTLQIIGQRGVNPTIASLIMSTESVISVLSGWLLLGQAMSARELLGCVLVFVAIILAQLPDKTRLAQTG